VVENKRLFLLLLSITKMKRKVCEYVNPMMMCRCVLSASVDTIFIVSFQVPVIAIRRTKLVTGLLPFDLWQYKKGERLRLRHETVLPLIITFQRSYIIIFECTCEEQREVRLWGVEFRLTEDGGRFTDLVAGEPNIRAISTSPGASRIFSSTYYGAANKWTGMKNTRFNKVDKRIRKVLS